MRTLFADTFYFLALLNGRDEFHAAAAGFSTDPATRVVTTAWVLTELADGLASTHGRRVVDAIVNDLRTDDHCSVVEAGRDVWDRGLALYRDRPDKRWSLTDCTSFVVMADAGIDEALTGDHHFEQAGFKALFRTGR